MADVIYINEDEGKKRVMNNGKLYAKLLTKFRNDIKLDDLENFVAVQDWDKAQAAAHTVKGTAANLSLTELFNQSLDVETQLKGKSCSPESMEKLKLCFNETLLAIDRVTAQYA